MKNTIRKLTALALVLTMVLSMSALAAKETPSKGFKLPEVKPRETEVPAETEMPVATDVPVDSEATEAPADPEATEAPAGETEESAEPETVIGTAYVSLENADSTLNVRAAASTESERLGSLNNGDQVSVLGNEGEWTKISYAGAAGYVKSSYLSDSPATEEPAVEPTEEPVVEPTEEPVVEPTEEPVVEPTEEPVVEPTEEPAVEPTEVPELEATVEPEPTAEIVNDGSYLVDAEGNVMFDLNGNAIPAGEYQVDENGELIFDENGNPIPVEVEEEIDLTGLRQIIVVLHEGETSLNLYAEANAESEVLATIGAGEILYVKDIDAVWSYAVYGDMEGYVLTEKIALFNESATPEEEEIIRTIKLNSNVASDEPVSAGTEIVMYAELTGFENSEYVLQWQYTPDGGATVYDIEGANDMQYSFVIDESNAHYLWRVTVTIIESAAEEVPAEEAEG